MDLIEVIKTSLDDIPNWCRNEPSDYIGSHDWINGYGDPNIEFLVKNKRHKLGEQMLPYYVCKHCHAVSYDKPECYSKGAILRKR